MPNWTSQATVKKHLVYNDISSSQIENERILLQGEIAYQLSRKSISEVNVKAIKSIDPTSDPKRLTGTSEIPLSNEQIVPGTVCVASDDILSIVYVEGIDYYISYIEGNISRIASGSIGDGDTPQIWYLYFHVYTAVTDYILDTDAGTITRTALGSINANSPIFVDFTSTAGTIDDNLIDQAILEAEDIIEQKLSSEYTITSEDQGLETGSTWLSIAIICKSKAAEAMLNNMSDDTDGIAKSWISLSSYYEKTALVVLSKFLSSTALRSMTTKRTVLT